MTDPKKMVITIDVNDAPAQAAAKRTGAALSDEVGKGAETGSQRASRALDQIQNAASTAAAGIKKTFELVATSAGVAFAAQSENIGSLINTYRAARIILSPTAFTAVTIAGGIAVEVIGRTVAAQARMIDSQALIAAKANLAYEDVERLSFVAERAGTGAQTFVDAYGVLASRLENGSTKSALQELNVDFTDILGSSRSAQEVFGELGGAFAAVKDPADKARLSVALFGNELGEKILPNLNARLAENVQRFQDWSLALDPSARKAVTALRNEVQDLEDNFLGVGDATVALARKLKQELVVGVAEGAATFRGLNDQLDRVRNGAPVGGNIAVPLNPPSAEALARDFRDAAGPDIRRLVGSGSTNRAVAPTIAPQIQTAANLAGAFDKTDAGLTRQLSSLQKQHDLYLDAARAGGILAAASGPLVAATNAQIDSILKEIDARKQLEQRQRANQAAEQAASEVLIRAQLTQKYNGEQLLAQRDEEIRQNGKTAKALTDLAGAYDILIDRELKDRQIKFDKEGSKLLQDSTDKRAAAEQSVLDVRNRATIETTQKLDQNQQQIDDARLKRQMDGLEATRDAELRSVEAVGNQSVAARVSAEQRKEEITETYLNQVEALESEQIDRRYQREMRSFEVLHQAKLISEQQYQTIVASMQSAADEDHQSAEQSIQAKIDAARQDAVTRSAQIVRDHNQEVFTSLKQEAGGVFDALLTKGQSVWSALGNSFKTAILTAIKDVVTSRIAASLTQIFTGAKVNLNGLGGPPSFGATSAPAGGGGILGSLGGLLGIGALGASPSFGASGLGGGVFGGSSTLGKPGGTPGFANLPLNLGSGTATTAGGLGGSKGLGGLGALASLKSLFFNSGGVNLAPGLALGPSGILGTLGGIAASPGAAILGGMTAASTLGRPGLGNALAGLASSTLTGFAVGSMIGPIGALLGAGIGAAVGGIGALVGVLRKSSEQKIVERVKAVYGVDIPKSIAHDPLLGIIQQSFGGNVDFGVRSPQIANLVQLYAMSTGQKTGIANIARPLYLSDMGGQVSQMASYQNGVSFAYGGGSAPIAGPVSSLVGVPPPYGSGPPVLNPQGKPIGPAPASPTLITLQLDGPATTALLKGTIVSSPGEVSQANLAAGKDSQGRLQSAVLQQSPSLLLA